MATGYLKVLWGGGFYLASNFPILGFLSLRTFSCPRRKEVGGCGDRMPNSRYRWSRPVEVLYAWLSIQLRNRQGSCLNSATPSLYYLGKPFPF